MKIRSARFLVLACLAVALPGLAAMPTKRADKPASIRDIEERVGRLLDESRAGDRGHGRKRSSKKKILEMISALHTSSLPETIKQKLLDTLRGEGLTIRHDPRLGDDGVYRDRVVFSSGSGIRYNDGGMLSSGYDKKKIGTVWLFDPSGSGLQWEVTPIGSHLSHIQAGDGSTLVANREGDVLTQQEARHVGLEKLIAWAGGSDEQTRSQVEQELRRLGFGPRPKRGPTRSAKVNEQAADKLAKAIDTIKKMLEKSDGLGDKKAPLESLVELLEKSGLPPAYATYGFAVIRRALDRHKVGESFTVKDYGSYTKLTAGNWDLSVTSDDKERLRSLNVSGMQEHPVDPDPVDPEVAKAFEVNQRTFSRKRTHRFNFDRLDSKLFLGRSNILLGEVEDPHRLNLTFLVNEQGEWKTIPSESVELKQRRGDWIPVVNHLHELRKGLADEPPPKEKNRVEPETLTSTGLPFMTTELVHRVTTTLGRAPSPATVQLIAAFVREAYPALFKVSPKQQLEEEARLELALVEIARMRSLNGGDTRTDVEFVDAQLRSMTIGYSKLSSPFRDMIVDFAVQDLVPWRKRLTNVLEVPTATVTKERDQIAEKVEQAVKVLATTEAELRQTRPRYFPEISDLGLQLQKELERIFGHGPEHVTK